MLLEFVALIALIYSTFGQGRGQARAPSRPGVMQARPGELPLPGFTLNGPLPQPQMMPRATGGQGMERMRTRNVFGRTTKTSRKGSRSPKFKGTRSGRRSNEMRMGMPGEFGRKPYVPPKPSVEVILEGMPEGGHPAEVPPGLW